MRLSLLCIFSKVTTQNTDIYIFIKEKSGIPQETEQKINQVNVDRYIIEELLSDNFRKFDTESGKLCQRLILDRNWSHLTF